MTLLRLPLKPLSFARLPARFSEELKSAALARLSGDSRPEMSAGEFARFCTGLCGMRVSLAFVRQWCALGMPHRVDETRAEDSRLRVWVHVRAAIDWLAAPAFVRALPEKPGDLIPIGRKKA